MKYKVVISDKSKEMLGVHIRFLSQVNRKSASDLKTRLIREIHSLEEMPQRFPFFNEAYIPPNKYHKLYVKEYYLVLYQIKDSTVYVDWIIDCRQDYQWLLK